MPGKYEMIRISEPEISSAQNGQVFMEDSLSVEGSAPIMGDASEPIKGPTPCSQDRPTSSPFRRDERVCALSPGAARSPWPAISTAPASTLQPLSKIRGWPAKRDPQKTETRSEKHAWGVECSVSRFSGLINRWEPGDSLNNLIFH